MSGALGRMPVHSDVVVEDIEGDDADDDEDRLADFDSKEE
jgi:hypothetical protein